MQAGCSACGAQYTIDDAKVAGKVVQYRCSKCQGVVTVDGTHLAPPKRTTQPMGVVGPSGQHAVPPVSPSGEHAIPRPQTPSQSPPMPAAVPPPPSRPPVDPLRQTMPVPPPPRPETPSRSPIEPTRRPTHEALGATLPGGADPLGATLAPGVPDPLGATLAVPAAGRPLPGMPPTRSPAQPLAATLVGGPQRPVSARAQTEPAAPPEPPAAPRPVRAPTMPPPSIAAKRSHTQPPPMPPAPPAHSPPTPPPMPAPRLTPQQAVAPTPPIAHAPAAPPAPPAQPIAPTKKARTAKPGLPHYRPRNVVIPTSRDASLPFIPRVALSPSKVDFEVPIEFNFEGHYDILGVSRSASAEEIKKAAFDMFGIYDRRARKGGDETATQRLQKVNEAQDVLGKPDKRTKYDREPESIFLTIQDPHPYERIAWNEGLDLIREVLLPSGVRDPLRELDARIDDADRPNAILDQLLRG